MSRTSRAARSKARANAGQLELDVYMLRRFDAVVLPEIQVSRRRCHVLILPRVPSRSERLIQPQAHALARFSTELQHLPGHFGCSCG